MDFAVLGPIEVHDQQIDVTPAAAMPRRVLATLLLHADQVVTIPTLVEELWDAEPPRLARKTVQTYVYQLRKALAGGPTGAARQLLETRPQGYRILLEPGELDLRLFEQRARVGRIALAAGDLGQAAACLREALSVWRGDALTDVVPGPVLSVQTSRLEDSRRGVLEQRVEADLRLGGHRDLIGELKTLMIRYPGHEEFCAQLMVAAYRSDRRDESLAAYDRLRRLVVEQSGLEPSERLRRLQHAVLVDSPSLALPDQHSPPPAPTRDAPAEIPPGPEHVVGRAHDLALIGAAVRRRPGAGSPGLVLLAGAPGTGKTATAVFAAHRLRDRFPDGQLFAGLHTESGAAADPLRVLQGFLRSISEDEPPTTLDAAARRFRSWSADRRVLVVLDDAASAAQVAPLLPNGKGCSTLITSRRLLPGLPGAAVIRLGPLDPCDGFRLLGLIAGEPRVLRHPEGALELIELCDRNPLAIRVAGERLAARPLLGVPELVDRLRPQESRLAELRVGSMDVLARLQEAGRRLTRAERNALRQLSGLGSGDFDLAQAMAALTADEPAAQQAISGLLESFQIEDAGIGADAWPWAARHFHMAELTRLAWQSAGGADAEPKQTHRHSLLCRSAARPPRPYAVRLLRYSCFPWDISKGRRT